MVAVEVLFGLGVAVFVAANVDVGVFVGCGVSVGFGVFVGADVLVGACVGVSVGCLVSSTMSWTSVETELPLVVLATTSCSPARAFGVVIVASNCPWSSATVCASEEPLSFQIISTDTPLSKPLPETVTVSPAAADDGSRLSVGLAALVG